MAKMYEGIQYTGTIGNLCFYMWRGINCVRTKSSLSGERVKKSKEFARTRKYASNFAIAARIASPVYKALPDEIRARWIYHSIVGDAASLLYKGKTESEVIDILWYKYIYDSQVEKKELKKAKSAKEIKPKKKSKSSLKEIFFTRWEIQGRTVHDFKRAWRNPREYDPEIARRFRDPFGVDKFLK
jgi:hypothetical protein